jgi:hypothetical protein
MRAGADRKAISIKFSGLLFKEHYSMRCERTADLKHKTRRVVMRNLLIRKGFVRSGRDAKLIGAFVSCIAFLGAGRSVARPFSARIPRKALPKAVIMDITVSTPISPALAVAAAAAAPKAGKVAADKRPVATAATGIPTAVPAMARAEMAAMAEMAAQLAPSSWMPITMAVAAVAAVAAATAATAASAGATWI